jgi:hypothetical protein
MLGAATRRPCSSMAGCSAAGGNNNGAFLASAELYDLGPTTGCQ